MNDRKALSGKAAVDKLKEIAEGKTCMFLTSLDERPVPARPMAVQQVCEHGNFWFFSSRESLKNQDVKLDPHVQLIFAEMGSLEFLSVYGHVTVVHDKKRKEELWNPMVKAWFPVGVDDPDLTVLKVTPEDTHYWDTKDGKVMSMLKIAISAVT